MKRLVVFVLLFLVGKSASAQVSDTSLWVPNGPVKALLLRDSLLYVGGTFSQISPVVGHFVAIDSASGSVVPPFPFVNGRVDCMAKDALGRIYVGGSFNKVGIYPCANLFRLTPQGDFDVTFFPDPDGEVFAITIEWNTVYIGGDFTSIYGNSRGRGAALDIADTLLPFDAQSNGPIYAICANKAGDELIVGGNFTWIGGATNLNICKLDRSGNYIQVGNAPWSAIPLTNGIVRSIVLVPPFVYIGGDFTAFGTLQRKGLAILDLQSGAVSSISPGVNGTVHDLELFDRKIYIGGNFSIVAGNFRSNLACISPPCNLLPWNPSADGQVYDLSVWDSTSICVGGNFKMLGGDSCFYAGVIDTNGHVHPINPLFDGPVYSVMSARWGTRFWVGGGFTGAGGVLRHNFCAINTNTKRPNNWSPNFNSTITTLYTDGIQLFAAGSFSNIGTNVRSGIASFDLATNTITNFNPGVNGVVRTMVVVNSKLFIGGNFSTTGNQTRNNIACLDLSTSQATTWNPGCTGSVNKIIADGNHLYVGGFYGQIGGQFRDNLARLDITTGATDFGWSCNTDDGVYDMNLYNGQLFIGGWFEHVVGQPRTYLAAVDTVSGNLTSFNPLLDDYIRTMERWNGDFFISGAFTNVGGNVISPKLCNYDIANGQFEQWAPYPNIFPESMQASQNWLYIGGSFTTAGFHYGPYLAMININNVTGIEEQNFGIGAGIKVWPNPASDFVFVSVSNHGTTTSGKTIVEVFDVNGKLVSEQTENSADGIFKIDFSTFESGMYFIKVMDENGNFACEKVMH